MKRLIQGLATAAWLGLAALGLASSARAQQPVSAAAEVDDAVAFARKSPFPPRTELNRHIFA